MFRWIVKFSIGIIELIKEFLFSKGLVAVILVWLVHIVIKIQKSQYVKKSAMFHCVAVKWCIELF